MRSLTTVCFIIFITASTAGAQIYSAGGGFVGGIPVRPPIAPIPYGLGNFVMDQKGRLLLFDVTYEYSSFTVGPPSTTVGAPTMIRPPTVKTRVTIVENDGSTKHDSTYNGSFQVVDAGRYAVYAIVTDYTPNATSTQVPAVITRRLVALGPSFPSLPSIDISAQAQVKVSAVGDDGAPDMVAVMDTPAVPVLFPPAGTMGPVPSMPIRPRTVQMFQSDGISFKPLTPTPLPVP